MLHKRKDRRNKMKRSKLKSNCISALSLTFLTLLFSALASAQTTIKLPDNWRFSPDGDIANSHIVEKLILTGWSHIDNNYTNGTFSETGLLQVSSYIDPMTGLAKPISDITQSDVYISWENLSGTQTISGTDVQIDFNNANIVKMFVDDAPIGTLKINDNDIIGSNDANSFTNLSNNLKLIAKFGIIDNILNTETNTVEFSGGSFDLNVAGAGGVGEFVIWTEMDVSPGHFFDMLGNDLDSIDSNISSDGTILSSGTLNARVSMDAQQDPFTFKDDSSTAPPGKPDDTDSSQEDNYEIAISAIHDINPPDLKQSLVTNGGNVILEDFFAFHRSDFDLQGKEEVIEPQACRLTGGGVDINGEIVIGSLAKAKDTDDKDRYQFGGQIGAPTAADPQPFGEWTHHQQRGPSGSFVFHAGTASAPAGTKITKVSCSDPGNCNPARPAPYKQMDFEGIGSFKNIKNKLEATVIPGETLHYFKAHVEDIGEPGPGGKQPKSDFCTHVIGEPIDETVDCSNCPDVYQLEIHATEDPASPVIYTIGGFIDGGNLQIHPAM